MKTWRCMENCGACCHLDPRDRPDLDHYLTPAELDLYLSFVGEDGWCIHFDPKTRQCRIYEQRPRFCRVQPEIFEQMYGIPKEDFEEFAIDCCDQQISGVYGHRSPKRQQYKQLVGFQGSQP
ncbi:YkgJ family cysteine cluster protein [Spirulina sp. CS-785/01]|uniref:YkgJ family cysteine cluster protein n=1 Tax=Spirulina sp. CS-785/01 TaxID=3021716 RepID=UPI00232DCE58|nr:YkgJ family cysteine cluster protein [Spirulina sp. CS-785/01]MDB9315687.1 YkgJ family cysteine cluster protein [Spirulina sp. CS-785/01]